jgi:hypothetical protein
MTSTTASVPVYEGRLAVEHDRDARPVLSISFHCPKCKRLHFHSWGLAEDGAEDFSVHHRRPHCTRHAAHSLGYFISPMPSPANAAVYRRYAQLLAEHQRQHQADDAGHELALRRAGAAAVAGAAAAAG